MSAQLSEAQPLTTQQRFLLEFLRRNDTLHRADTFALRLTGNLDVQALRGSLQELVRRHECLRTRIAIMGGELKQQISSSSECELQILSAGAVSHPETAARALFEQMAARRCDIGVGPLFSVSLLSAGEREHFLVWSLHHIVTDGPSLNLLFREFWRVYGELVKGRAAPLRRPSAQYSEYAIWQQRTDADWEARCRAYWEARLMQATPLRWPARVGNEVHPGLCAAKASLGAALSAQLKELATRERAQVAMAVLSVYVAVAARWCGQSDFVIPFNIGSRDRPVFENTTGYFARHLYLRVTLTGAETFLDLLNALGRELYRSLLHQDFGRVALKAPELWTTLIQWCSWDAAEAFGVPTPSEADALDMRVALFEPDLRRFTRRPIVLEGAATPWDLSLSFFDERDGICAYLGARAELFGPRELEQFADQLVLTAQRFVANPAAVVGG